MTVIVRRRCYDRPRHSVNDSDATNPVLVPGRETYNESNSKSNRDRDSYTQWLQKWPWQLHTVTSKVTVTAALTDSNNANDSESGSVNNSDVTNSVSVSVGGIATTRLTLTLTVKQPVFCHAQLSK